MERIKDELVVSEEEVVVSFEITDDKPFNQCFRCHSFRNGCSGPNLSIMDVTRACEFLQSARVFLGVSYQQVADDTGVSLSTVKRTLTNKVGDPSFYTMSTLAHYLLGDPSGKYPCAIPNIGADTENVAKLNDALRELERALTDNKDYREALDSIHASYNAEMQLIRDEAQRKIDFLLGELQRLREESDGWRKESERKSKIVDAYINRLIK